ncbi:hypothetical protein [Bradyrhizobium sp. CCBAU 11445]|uniref:hypothetical protein n=1 Tax=Bradyrhizobium sp. CCBAU 11445 TaxID=1630896 RepID=UPI00230625B0|nr:hypothetical protein [Bradyrhizobium sp. CCBAU 11445]
MKSMLITIRQLWLKLRSQTGVDAIALNPSFVDGCSTPARYGPPEMHNLYRYVDDSLNRWARRKYKGQKNGKGRASTWLLIRRRMPKLFAHWAKLISASVLVQSRMT